MGAGGCNCEATSECTCHADDDDGAGWWLDMAGHASEGMGAHGDADGTDVGAGGWHCDATSECTCQGDGDEGASANACGGVGDNSDDGPGKLHVVGDAQGDADVCTSAHACGAHGDNIVEPLGKHIDDVGSGKAGCSIAKGTSRRLRSKSSTISMSPSSFSSMSVSGSVRCDRQSVPVTLSQLSSNCCHDMLLGARAASKQAARAETAIMAGVLMIGGRLCASIAVCLAQGLMPWQTSKLTHDRQMD